MNAFSPPRKSARKKREAFLTSIERHFLQSWWMVIFILCCYLGYEQGLNKREEDFSKLHHQYTGLLQEKKQLEIQRESLLRQINSQSDPDWVELTLMKGLGLVAEGQTKVLFTDQLELLQR